MMGEMNREQEARGKKFGIFAKGLLALMEEKGITLDQALAQAIAGTDSVSKNNIPGFQAAAELIRLQQQSVSTTLGK